MIKIGNIVLTETEAKEYLAQGRTIFVTYSKVWRLNQDMTATLLKKGEKGQTLRGRFYAMTEEVGKGWY